MSLSPDYSCSNSAIVNRFIAGIPEHERTPLLQHVSKAEAILSDAKVNPPVAPELEYIVAAAFKAFELYVTAGIEQRDKDHWESFFRRFVLICSRQLSQLEARKWNADQDSAGGKGERTHGRTN